MWQIEEIARMLEELLNDVEEQDTEDITGEP